MSRSVWLRFFVVWGWSRLALLRVVLFLVGISLSGLASLRSVWSCVVFGWSRLVSAGLAAFCVVLCIFLFLSTALAAFCVVRNVLGWSQLVSPNLAAFCIDLSGFGLASVCVASTRGRRIVRSFGMALKLLNWVFTFCSIGSCPLDLDTLLDTDLGQSECVPTRLLIDAPP